MSKPSRLSTMSFFSGPPRFLAAFPRFSSALTIKHAPSPLRNGDMVDIPLDQPIVPRDSTRLRRNKTERVRLQGLVHTMRETKDGDGEEGGRVRKTLGRLERASVWMVNEGEFYSDSGRGA